MQEAVQTGSPNLALHRLIAPSEPIAQRGLTPNDPA